jgi:hypothetical protein
MTEPPEGKVKLPELLTLTWPWKVLFRWLAQVPVTLVVVSLTFQTSVNCRVDTVTVIVSVPDLPCAVAVMVAVPAATAVTRPPLDTVATAAFEDCHVALLVTFCVVPLDSVAVAVS